MSDFETPKDRQIDETDEYQTFSKEIDYLIRFFEDFADHIGCTRLISFITAQEIYNLNTQLIGSSAQTLKSIKLSCSIGSFSDANILIRKLRDDLILYAYLLNIIKLRKPFYEEGLENVNIENPEEFLKIFENLRFNNNMTQDELAAQSWFCNQVSELPGPIKKKLAFTNYMKILRQNESINQILEDYHLQNYWDVLRENLNDYVHTNGHQFTTQNTVSAYSTNLKAQLENVNIKISYIASFFVVLIIMIDSTLIASSDYVDHLEMDLEPPEDAQYSIAKYIQDFIDTKITKLHPGLKQYLKDNNSYGMKIK